MMLFGSVICKDFVPSGAGPCRTCHLQRDPLAIFKNPYCWSKGDPLHTCPGWLYGQISAQARPRDIGALSMALLKSDVERGLVEIVQQFDDIHMSGGKIYNVCHNHLWKLRRSPTQVHTMTCHFQGAHGRFRRT